MDPYFLETLPSGKKISLFSSLAVAFLMLTAFVGSLSISRGAGFSWVAWVAYFASFGYALTVLLDDLDLKQPVGILRLSTLCLAFVGSIALIMDFSGATGGTTIFSMIMCLLAFMSAGAVVIIEITSVKTFNILYTILATAFLLLAVFLIVFLAYGKFNKPVFGMKIAFVISTLLFAVAAGWKCYQIVKE